MHIKKRYSLEDLFFWTRFESSFFVLVIVVLVSLFYFFELHWIKVPRTPLALIGTAVAFVIGFQNNVAYDRIWEARKIWGGIVNTSRTLAVFAQDMITNEHSDSPFSEEELKEEIRIITYRHIAWMTALRHSMRSSKPWETTVNHKTNQEWNIRPPEMDSNL